MDWRIIIDEAACGYFIDIPNKGDRFYGTESITIFSGGHKRTEYFRCSRILTSVATDTFNEIATSDDFIAGDITIGAGETDGIRFLARAAKTLQEQYPDIHLHIISGDGESVEENLDRGLIDFGFMCREIDTAK